jgi:hypothetical protein
MQLSEYIKSLQAILDKEGDVPVVSVDVCDGIIEPASPSFLQDAIVFRGPEEDARIMDREDFLDYGFEEDDLEEALGPRVLV